MLEKYHRLTEATGVSLYIEADGTELWGLCRVEVRNNQLNIAEKAYGLTRNALLERLKTGIPIAFNVSGKGLLDKVSEKIIHVDQAGLSKLLPGASLNDFYVQHFISGEKSFISLLRRTEAQKWLDLFAQRNLPVLMLTFEPFPVQQVISQFNFYQAEVLAGHYLIARNDRGEWICCDENPQNKAPDYPLRLAGEDFDHRVLPAYASAFQLILADSLTVIESQCDHVIQDRIDYLTQRKYRSYAAMALMACFVTLLINFALFSSLNSSNERLTNEADRSAQTTADQQQLSREVAGEEELLQTLGWDGGKSKAVMADRIASLMPANLSLTGLAIQPTDAVAARMRQTLQFKDKVITISGTSDRVVPVNEWIARLKTQKWVREARLESFVLDPERSTGRFLVQLDY